MSTLDSWPGDAKKHRDMLVKMLELLRGIYKVEQYSRLCACIEGDKAIVPNTSRVVTEILWPVMENVELMELYDAFLATLPAVVDDCMDI